MDKSEKNRLQKLFSEKPDKWIRESLAQGPGSFSNPELFELLLAEAAARNMDLSGSVHSAVSNPSSRKKGPDQTPLSEEEKSQLHKMYSEMSDEEIRESLRQISKDYDPAAYHLLLNEAEARKLDLSAPAHLPAAPQEAEDEEEDIGGDATRAGTFQLENYSVGNLTEEEKVRFQKSYSEKTDAWIKESIIKGPEGYQAGVFRLLLEEALTRKLHLPALIHRGQRKAVLPETVSPEKWVMVARFDKVMNAHMARMRLQLEGIPCEFYDEHIVTLNWFFSLLVGGIKLRVAEKDEARAREILESLD